MQKDVQGREVAVAFASRTLHKSERPYSTPEKECLAVIWALEHFRPYVEGLHVTIFTDHSGLTWLMSRSNPTGRLARWSLRLQDFDFDVIHKPGERSKVPDALSRNPLQSDESPMGILPEHAIIGGLELRSSTALLLSDRSHVKQLQLDDPVTGDLLRMMETTPQSSGTTEESSQFSVHDGLLYFNDPTSACSVHPLKRLRLYVPESLKNTVLQYYHDHPTAGHLGMTKTLARLKHRFFWPNMSSGVKKYVSSCKVCQLTKPCQRKPAGLMVPIRPQGPWEFVGVDFVGPLPRTSNGNAYILVFVDYFSKWVEIVAVKEATAQVAASRLLSEVFSRHGAPTHLISDRGSPFVSHLFEKLLTLIGTEHRLTTAYHPQTNATERVNRTLKTAIRAYVDDKHTSWDKYIPQICFALRTAPHESTGQSPAMLLYGRELNTPLDLVSHPNGDGELDIDIPYLEQLQSSLREAHEHAKASLEVNHARRKKYYNKRRRSVHFSIGDLIRVRNHPKSDALTNFTTKLVPLYSGPCCVTQVLSDVNYRLRKLDTEEDAGVFYVVNMQPFHTRSESRVHGTDGFLSGCDELAEDLEGGVFPSRYVDSCFPDAANAACDSLSDMVYDVSTGDGASFAPVADFDVSAHDLYDYNCDDARQSHCYDLRPRLAPRVTADWSQRKWTNDYHTNRLNFNW
uniref:Gypsy retrotransposon integrase-like protein 1 n=1 Tax=Paramormyrops kingsleyae TaxID=1676925 RepID=A0A3B3RAY2_9TELE